MEKSQLRRFKMIVLPAIATLVVLFAGCAPSPGPSTAIASPRQSEVPEVILFPINYKDGVFGYIAPDSGESDESEVWGGLWGFMDASGKIVIEPQFEDFYRPYRFKPLFDTFSEGLAAVKKDGMWGYIDSSGDFAIDPQFEEAYAFSGGLAAVLADDKWGFIDKSGKMVVPPRFTWFAEGFSEGLVAVTEGDKYGFIDDKGNWSIEPRFEEARHFTESRAAVMVNDKWGFVDTSGRMVIQPQFSEAWEFSEGLAAVAIEQGTDLRLGFIDRSGNFVIQPRFGVGEPYYDWRGFKEGLACVLDTSYQNRYIDKSGAFAFDSSFDMAYPFSEGLAAIDDYESGLGFIDRDGKFVIQPTLPFATSYSNGLAAVFEYPNLAWDEPGDTPGRFYYIDKSGQKITVRR